MNCCLYDEKNQKIVLFVDAQVDRDYIKERIEKLVPEYMIPGKVIYLENMPINANGKIDRIKLKELVSVLSCCSYWIWSSYRRSA